MSIYFNLFHSGKLLFPRAAASHLHGVTGPIAQLTPVDGGSFTLVRLRMVGNPWENTWKWMEMVDLGMMKLGRKTQRFFQLTHGLKRWFYLGAFCLIMTEAVKWMITRKQHWWSGQPGGQIHKNQRWTANGSRAEYHLSQPSRANHLTWQVIPLPCVTTICCSLHERPKNIWLFSDTLQKKKWLWLGLS